MQRVTSRVAGDQRDDQSGDDLPARHPARRTSGRASWTKHAHRVGDWTGAGWPLGLRGCKVGSRQDVPDLGKAVFTPMERW